MATTGPSKRDGEEERPANRFDDGGRLTRRRYLGALGAATAAGLAGCSGVFGQETSTTSTTTTNGSATATDSTTASGSATTTGSATTVENTTANGTATAESPYTEVYRNTVDSVVLVEVTTSMGAAEGTGFVYDDSHIVTNAHVVGDADSAQLQFSDETYPDATVVGTDVSSDLAVLRTTVPDGIAALPLHTAQPAVGTRVLAIGNPYGQFDGSASAGIVSGVDRSIRAQNGYTIPDAIQTDAPVNPGNSGGPLMNLDSEVLGVVNSGGGENIAFAISAALVERVVPSLIENGEYRHSYLGVGLDSVTPDVADQVGLDRARGVLVQQVRANGPSNGTLLRGDVIVRLGDRRVDSVQQLSSSLALHTSPGDTIDVTVIRNGSRRTVQLTLEARPENPTLGTVATSSG